MLPACLRMPKWCIDARGFRRSQATLLARLKMPPKTSQVRSAKGTIVIHISEVWAQLEAHLQRVAPEQLVDLNGPAATADIAALEREVGRTLPQAFKECLACHDGQVGEADWLFCGEEFLSIARILSEWRVLTRMDREGDFDTRESRPGFGVKAGWWRSGWIPFTADGAGNHLCLDLDPAPGGCVGQVVAFDHEFESRDVQSPSFALWFADFTRDTVAQSQRGVEE